MTILEEMADMGSVAGYLAISPLKTSTDLFPAASSVYVIFQAVCHVRESPVLLTHRNQPYNIPPDMIMKKVRRS